MSAVTLTFFKQIASNLNTVTKMILVNSQVHLFQAEKRSLGA